MSCYRFLQAWPSWLLPEHLWIIFLVLSPFMLVTAFARIIFPREKFETMIWRYGLIRVIAWLGTYVAFFVFTIAIFSTCLHYVINNWIC